MFGIGFSELVLILIVALLVLGPERLVRLSKDAGKLLGELKKVASQVRHGIDRAEENSEKNK